MSVGPADESPGLRYQPDDRIPAKLVIGMGIQLAVLNIAGVMLIPMVVMRAANVSDAYLSWGVLASVIVSGATTMLQAGRLRRIGAGHVLVMGASGAFIPVCIMALTEVGPAQLATLVVISAVVPLVLSWRLSLFQRILTPSVAGTVIMLIPVTVSPYVAGLIQGGTAGGAAAAGGPLSFVATVLLIGAIVLRGTGTLRLWAPVIGVAGGSALAGYYGLYDLERVATAAWLAPPSPRPPGLDLEFGPAFWTLLPSFLLVAVIAAVRTMSSAVAIQRVSWRRRSRAVDFQAVQGAVAVDGVGNLMAGIAGTVPGTATTASISLTQLTGVAARGIGIVAGATFIAFAFLPKAFAVVLAIPDPVFAGYLAVVVAMLFIIGAKIVIQGGIDYRAGIVVGIGLLVGTSFQYGMVFPELIASFAGGLLANGMNAGGFTAILLTLFLRITEPRRARIETNSDLSKLPAISEFLAAFGARSDLDRKATDRLQAAAEEALLALDLLDDSPDGPDARRLVLTAWREKGDVTLEFVFAPTGDNLQDRLALLSGETGEQSFEHEVSERLLRHLASSVRHRQYYDTDIVTVRVGTVAAF